MAALHAALKALGPVEFAEIPTDVNELDAYVSDLFTQSQLVVDSIPIEDASAQAANDSKPFHATSASEIRLSSARGDPPSEEASSLQKAWGKPIKLNAKDNVLGMSVYKTSGKDGKGAWFARRSVHEGLDFAKFKRGMEQEFEESLAVHGAPGEGNIRGIGGEERVERIEVPGKGKVEVFRLSAQFPGPTSPRDFVTLLVTSDTAANIGKTDPPKSTPRHYMMISKPCDHPDTQPQNGFIRGSYESVEFIREIPRKLKTSMSSTELHQASSTDTDDIGRDAVIRNAQQRTKTFHGDTNLSKEFSEKDEGNPVEWIMVTRSDPGGSVPRFMVERGTPASICADAVKFLDWACQDSTDEDQNGKEPTADALRPPTGRRDSYQSFRSSRVVGVEDENAGESGAVPADNEQERSNDASHPSSSGLIGAVTEAVSAYTPQIVLDHLPGGATTKSAANTDQENETSLPVADNGDDRASILSTTSFQSAEDHLTMTSEDEASDAHSGSSKTTHSKDKENNRPRSQHEKELAKLEQRRATLESKFAASRTKLTDQITEQNSKEEASHRKAMEKHERELKKHEEKYEKEMKKLEERQQKERQKLEEKKRKQADKNEQGRLTRERDEARKESELFKKEAELLRGVIEDLQRENTALVAKLGKLSNSAVGEVRSEIASTTSLSRISGDSGSRSRSTSLRHAGLVSRDTLPEKSTSTLSSGHGHGHLTSDEEASIKSTKS